MSKSAKKPFKKRRVELVFDESARREYLTGFRKRKLERQKKAQEELEVQLKAEKKRLKTEVKENLSKLYRLSSRPIPELEEVLKEEEYDTGNVVVKITELSTSELAKENNWIGHNEAFSQPDSDTEEETAEVEEEDPDENAVPGMSMTAPKKPKPVKEGEEKKEKTRPTDIKKEMKQKTAAAMKSSKLIQLKNKLERAKNVKQAKKDRHKKARQFRDQAKKHGKSGRKPQPGASGGGGKRKPNKRKK